MITQFLVRDLISHRLQWIILLVMTVPALIFADFLHVLFFVYILFCISAMNDIIGVTWRSQHVMSRNYMLSLPISRNKMFFLNQLRAFVFGLPMFIYLVCLPYTELKKPAKLFVSENFSVGQYGLVVLISMFWFFNSMFYTAVKTEKISSHLSVVQRILSHILLHGMHVIEVVVYGVPLFGYTINKFPFWVPLLVVLLLTGNKIFLARRNWVIQR